MTTFVLSGMWVRAWGCIRGKAVLLLWTVNPEAPGFQVLTEWVPIFYEAPSTAQGLPEVSSLQGSTLVPEQLNLKAVSGAGACKLIDGCSCDWPHLQWHRLAYTTKSQFNGVTFVIYCLIYLLTYLHRAASGEYIENQIVVYPIEIVVLFLWSIP